MCVIIHCIMCSDSRLYIYWYSLIFIDIHWYSLIFIDNWYSLVFIDIHCISVYTTCFYWRFCAVQPRNMLRFSHCSTTCCSSRQASWNSARLSSASFSRRSSCGIVGSRDYYTICFYVFLCVSSLVFILWFCLYNINRYDIYFIYSL